MLVRGTWKSSNPFKLHRGIRWVPTARTSSLSHQVILLGGSLIRVVDGLLAGLAQAPQ